MTDISTGRAASAAALLRATTREHLEGDPVLLQDLQTHFSALRLQVARVTNPTLRQLMVTEIGCAEQVLRRFSIVRVDPVDALAEAERALAAVRAYSARMEYAEGLGYAKSALASVVQSLGGPPMPPRSRSH